MPKRGESASPAQRAALKRGQKRRADMLEQGGDRARDRWARLLDGTLTVEELDDDEIAKMRVRGKGGTFGGKAPKMPSHLVQAFHRESIRRSQDKFRTAAPEAVQALIDIGTNPEVKESDRVRALTFVIERALGKTPEVIRVEGVSEFDKMSSEAVGLVRDLAPDDASELS